MDEKSAGQDEQKKMVQSILEEQNTLLNLLLIVLENLRVEIKIVEVKTRSF